MLIKTEFHLVAMSVFKPQMRISLPAITCFKSRMKTPEQGVKFVQS